MKAVNGETLLIKTPVDLVRGKEIEKKHTALAKKIKFKKKGGVNNEILQ